MNDSKVEQGVIQTLLGLGIDLSDPNFEDTPKRIVKAYREIFSGMNDTEQQVKDILVGIGYQAEFSGQIGGIALRNEAGNRAEQ